VLPCPTLAETQERGRGYCIIVQPLGGCFCEPHACARWVRWGSRSRYVAALLPERGLACPWIPTELAGPYEGLTLREWEVSIVVCALCLALRDLLREALLDPARPACWRRQGHLPRQVLAFDEHFLRKGTIDARRAQLQSVLVLIWQVLDAPPYALTGMQRDLVLAGLSIRLRQILDAFPGTIGARSPKNELRHALTALGVILDPEDDPLARFHTPRQGWRWWRRAA
jgi:hypothetical protein